mmetsp:Transcript_81843/g.228001  ORF Transcript_81843/g.228001 Transcript_81843/m.228001 type:complete len:212 (+) Transcript_81843:2492-3127(+)
MIFCHPPQKYQVMLHRFDPLSLYLRLVCSWGHQQRRNRSGGASPHGLGYRGAMRGSQQVRPRPHVKRRNAMLDDEAAETLGDTEPLALLQIVAKHRLLHAAQRAMLDAATWEHRPTIFECRALQWDLRRHLKLAGPTEYPRKRLVGHFTGLFRKAPSTTGVASRQSWRDRGVVARRVDGVHLSIACMFMVVLQALVLEETREAIWLRMPLR